MTIITINAVFEFFEITVDVPESKAVARLKSIQQSFVERTRIYKVGKTNVQGRKGKLTVTTNIKNP